MTCRRFVPWSPSEVHHGTNRRLATEALAAILAYGFSELGLHRVEAQTVADNEESVRLLDRLGFQREGTRRGHSFEEDGLFHDEAIYGLLAPVRP